jgi:hypothetical protein
MQQVVLRANSMRPPFRTDLPLGWRLTSLLGDPVVIRSKQKSNFLEFSLELYLTRAIMKYRLKDRQKEDIHANLKSWVANNILAQS